MHAHTCAHLQRINYMKCRIKHHASCVTLVFPPFVSNVQLSKSQQPNGGLAFFFSLYTPFIAVASTNNRARRSILGTTPNQYIFRIVLMSLCVRVWSHDFITPFCRHMFRLILCATITSEIKKNRIRRASE